MDELKRLWPTLKASERTVLLDLAEGFAEAHRMATAKGPDAWLTMKRACKEYEVPDRTLREAVRHGDVEGRRPNGCSRGLRVNRESLERWLYGT